MRSLNCLMLSILKPYTYTDMKSVIHLIRYILWITRQLNCQGFTLNPLKKHGMSDLTETNEVNPQEIFFPGFLEPRYSSTRGMPHWLS